MPSSTIIIISRLAIHIERASLVSRKDAIHACPGDGHILGFGRDVEDPTLMCGRRNQEIYISIRSKYK
jgi:hypothetical protein